MEYYYKLVTHADHIGGGLHLANENFEQIKGVLRNGQKLAHKMLYFVADDNSNWHETLANVDLLKAQKPIISQKAYELLKPFLKDNAQVIPCKIGYKQKVYHNFYLLIAITPIALVDAYRSTFRITQNEKGDDEIALPTSFDFYREEIQKGSYQSLKDKVDIAYDVLLSSDIIVSKDVAEALAKSNLKIACATLNACDPWFGMHQDHYKPKQQEALKPIIKKDLERACNYPFLKEIFGWED